MPITGEQLSISLNRQNGCVQQPHRIAARHRQKRTAGTPLAMAYAGGQPLRSAGFAVQAVAFDVADGLALRGLVRLLRVASAEFDLVQVARAVVQVVQGAFQARLPGLRGQYGPGAVGRAQTRNYQQAKRDDDEEAAAHIENYGRSRHALHKKELAARAVSVF